MNHLKQHANPTDDSSLQCIYCLENWADNDKLSRHLVLAHPIETKSHAGVECLLCEVFALHSSQICQWKFEYFFFKFCFFLVSCKLQQRSGQSHAKASRSS